MFIRSRSFDITVASGTGADSDSFKHEVLKQVIITPPVSTAEYDFDITNAASRSLFGLVDSEGLLNEQTDILMRDQHTFTITNASDDGVYNVTLLSYEPHG